MRGQDATQHSICLQCKSLWQEIVSQWEIRPLPSSLPHNPAGWISTTHKPPGHHHHSLIELRNSATDGCLLCCLLWQIAAVKGLQEMESLLTAGYSLNVETGEYWTYFSDITVSIPKELQVDGHPRGVRLVRRIHDNNFSRLDYRDSSTASDGCFKTARTWLTDCVTNHMPCSLAEKVRRLERGHFTPRRLLKLDIRGIQTCIQLLSKTTVIEPPPDYMTLSHCWGLKKPLMLKKDNLSLLEDGIQLEELPKTYADAVVITLRMGYQYLWIDSLCIVQDSTEDWEAAVLQMGNIYRFSFCNIAALDAVDATQGCFSTRIPHLVRVCDFEVDGQPYSAEQGGYIYLETSSSRLYQRGWVLQERILAPRTIGYNSDGLNWECLVGFEQEDLEHGDPQQIDIYDFKQALHQNQRLKEGFATNNMTGTRPPMSTEDYHIKYPVTGRAWHIVLERYTHLQLTFRLDRWAAISGVARAMQALTGCSLLAGNWRETMLLGLGWLARKPGEKISNSYPSWSWVSVDAPLTWDYIEGNRIVYSIESLPEGPEDFMSAGVRLPVMPIRLRGRLRQMTVHRVPHTEDGRNLRSTSMSQLGQFDVDAHYDYNERPSGSIWAFLQYYWVHVPEPLHSMDPKFGFFGMLVIPVSGQESHWNRVGCFMKSTVEPGHDWIKDSDAFGPIEDIVVI
ncbi:hypothetical protein PV11_04801 [Exophiala sideris]|uniref:Heterokaryon incompatibility domain-containing protein n=1 Tax=Exophiala sideris TaxID=1016849 RepID=A0A0D1YIJ8_9EURO|nr:hypothetical protein PV11_04801 [Exophiala sideris]